MKEIFAFHVMEGVKTRFCPKRLSRAIRAEHLATAASEVMSQQWENIAESQRSSGKSEPSTRAGVVLEHSQMEADEKIPSVYL